MHSRAPRHIGENGNKPHHAYAHPSTRNREVAKEEIEGLHESHVEELTYRLKKVRFFTILQFSFSPIVRTIAILPRTDPRRMSEKQGISRKHVVSPRSYRRVRTLWSSLCRPRGHWHIRSIRNHWYTGKKENTALRVWGERGWKQSLETAKYIWILILGMPTPNRGLFFQSPTTAYIYSVCGQIT